MVSDAVRAASTGSAPSERATRYETQNVSPAPVGSTVPSIGVAGTRLAVKVVTTIAPS